MYINATLVIKTKYDDNVIEFHVNPKYGNANMYKSHGNDKLLERLVEDTKGFSLSELSYSKLVWGNKIYDMYIGGNSMYVFIRCGDIVKIWTINTAIDKVVLDNYFEDTDVVYTAYINSTSTVSENNENEVYRTYKFGDAPKHGDIVWDKKFQQKTIVHYDINNYMFIGREATSCRYAELDDIQPYHPSLELKSYMHKKYKIEMDDKSLMDIVDICVRAMNHQMTKI